MNLRQLFERAVQKAGGDRKGQTALAKTLSETTGWKVSQQHISVMLKREKPPTSSRLTPYILDFLGYSRDWVNGAEPMLKDSTPTSTGRSVGHSPAGKNYGNNMTDGGDAPRLTRRALKKMYQEAGRDSEREAWQLIQAWRNLPPNLQEQYLQEIVAASIQFRRKKPELALVPPPKKRSPNGAVKRRRIPLGATGINENI